MRFSHPWFLSLLILIIPIVVFTLKRRSSAFAISSLLDLKNQVEKKSLNPKYILLTLRVAALLLIIVALARPQAGKRYSEVSSDGVDIMLAIDTSKSMEAQDLLLDGKRASRLDVVKSVVKKFVKERPSDRLGLVVFGQNAFTQCPLTLDHGIVMDFIDRFYTGVAGDSTAIGDAIVTAVKRMKDLKAKSKVVILLTDGESNSGDIDPINASLVAQKMGVKVYTIGVGSESGRAPIPVKTLFGMSLQYIDVSIDEKTLKTIAENSGGQYFRASDTDRLIDIYSQINKMEKSEVKVKEYTEYQELYLPFVLAALLFLIIEILLSQTIFRKFP